MSSEITENRCSIDESTSYSEEVFSVSRKRAKRTKSRRWRKLTNKQKLTLALEEVARQDGMCLSLNLSPDVQKEIKEKGIKLLYDRISASMYRKFEQLLPFVIALDTDRKGRLHVHGAVLTSNHGQLDRLRPLLMQAGGRWEHNHGKQFQLDLRPITNAKGWATYITRNHGKLEASAPKRQLMIMTDGMRRLGRASGISPN